LVCRRHLAHLRSSLPCTPPLPCAPPRQTRLGVGRSQHSGRWQATGWTRGSGLCGMAGGGCRRVASELVCVRRAGTLPRSHTAVYIPTSLPAHLSLFAVSPRAEPVPVSAYAGRSKNLGSFGGRAHHRVRVLRHTSFREREIFTDTRADTFCLPSVPPASSSEGDEFHLRSCKFRLLKACNVLVILPVWD
jgi:hypothetical protein